MCILTTIISIILSITTKHRGLEKSSGLGLAIVYSIIKAFHGDLYVISNLRQGTSVKIHLPEYKKK